ncbi:hypothetical protein [Archaeoglobus neptunius]|uniref:hypothetical protein n=1 Tax=Archaeoglobus neptunius TaxID=2798580 RepID=UPI0019276DD5|nr:hypothetical protein [Archaeoglobus neptunius]
MNLKAAAVVFLMVALLFAGCQGKTGKTGKTGVQPTTPAQPTTPSLPTDSGQNPGQMDNNEDLNVTKDLQDLEQLLQELDSLDNVQFNV